MACGSALSLADAPSVDEPLAESPPGCSRSILAMIVKDMAEHTLSMSVMNLAQVLGGWFGGRVAS